MKHIILILLAASGAVRAQSSWPDAAAVDEAMRRANNYWTNHHSLGNAGWARGAYYTGNQRAFRVLGERGYWSWASAWGGVNQWMIGPEGAGHADAYCCGQTYIDLYRLSTQAVQLADIKAKTDALVASTNVSGWWWIDAFYMQGPVLARLGSLTGDTNYYEKLWLMYDDMKTRRGLFDAGESLWYRDAAYFPPATTANGEKIFWSRGNGWVFAGLARVLQQMNTNAPHRQEYLTMFQAMAPALKARQGADGLWRSSLNDPAEYPNPETSGTGFFTYGLAWGVRNGLLPAADYTNTIRLAWHGLTNLSLSADGLVGYCQNVGAQPAAATASNSTDFGVGAFLLACSEIYLRATNAPALRPWAGPDQTLVDLNGNGTEPIALDASQTEIYQGAAVAYSWWLGTNQFASGITAATNLSPGTNVITLKVTGSDGRIYTDSMTVRVVVPVAVTPVLKLRFGFEDAGTATTDSVAGVSLNLLNAGGTAADLHGAAGSGVAGTGRALDFTSAAAQGGSGPIAVTTGNSLIDFGSVNAFTVTLWLKPRSNLLASVFPRFISLGTNGLVDRGVSNSLQLLNNGVNLPSTTSVQAFVNTNQTSLTAFGGFGLPINQWRFLALTYNGATLNYYGGSESNAVTLVSSAAFPAGPVALGNSWSLFLGNRLARDRAFCGWFDDVRFYLEAAPLDYLETVRQAALPPGRIASGLQGTNLFLQLNTHAGLKYILESATRLAPAPDWTAIRTNDGNGGYLTNSVPVKPAVACSFFRYRIQ